MDKLHNWNIKKRDGRVVFIVPDVGLCIGCDLLNDLCIRDPVNGGDADRVIKTESFAFKQAIKREKEISKCGVILQIKGLNSNQSKK